MVVAHSRGGAGMKVSINRDPRMPEHGQIVATCPGCGVRTYLAGGPGRVVFLVGGSLDGAPLLAALLAHEACR